MKLRHYRVAFGIALLQALLSAAAAADSFELSSEQMRRLGIEVEAPVAIEAMTVATGPAEIVIPPARLAVASAPTGGMLARLYVAAGESVRQGQVFAELESPDLLEWQREFLEAAIESELANLQLARDRALVADGIVAERRLEEADARARAAAARVEQARRQLGIAGLGSAAIETLARTGELGSRLELRAPIDGVVTGRFADPGARLAPLDPVASFADLSEIWVEMHLSAESVARVEPGMRIVLPAPGMRAEAPITVVGAVIEPETQTVLVRAVLDNPGSRLRAGQFFNAEIVAADGGGFRLPAAAVVRNGDTAYVFVREPGGFRAVAVLPTHEDERYVLIGDGDGDGDGDAAGIDAGSEVAVRGTSTLKSIWTGSEEASP